MDFSAVFDLVDHDIFLLKLKGYIFSQDALDWIKTYLLRNISNPPTMRTGPDFKSAQFDHVRGEAEDRYVLDQNART